MGVPFCKKCVSGRVRSAYPLPTLTQSAALSQGRRRYRFWKRRTSNHTQRPGRIIYPMVCCFGRICTNSLMMDTSPLLPALSLRSALASARSSTTGANTINTMASNWLTCPGCLMRGPHDTIWTTITQSYTGGEFCHYEENIILRQNVFHTSRWPSA